MIFQGRYFYRLGFFEVKLFKCKIQKIVAIFNKKLF
jgi:hypothetical protein